jgi:hypothetical protein
MKKHWLSGLLLGVSLALLLGGVVAAQETRPLKIIEPPQPPGAVEGVYVTTEDNENNEGTGQADEDMGYVDPPFVCPESENAPIEFNIVVGDEICSAGVLSLAAMDWESGQHQVYINDHFLGTIPDIDEEVWEVLDFDVPQSFLNKGANLVQIELVEDCGYIAWGSLAIEPCEEFVPEPGSILLLGSGLMGLAGYAGLRRRSAWAVVRGTRE